MEKLESKLDFKNKKIVVIGDVMLDSFIDGKVERISPEAPVPIVKVESEKYFLGGAANVANNIHSLGGKVSLFGFIGKDIAGEKLKNILEEKNINFSPSYCRETIHKERISPAGHQLARLDRGELNEPKEFDNYAALAREVLNSDLVVVSDYAKGTMNPELMHFLIKSQKKVLVDPRPQNIGLYSGVFLVTPNEKEAFEMAKSKDVQECAKILREKLGSNVIITRGKEGMLIYDGVNIKEIPTFAKEVYDVIGAGDTAIAALALSISAGKNLEDSAIIANHAAGIVVGKRGTATVSLSELESKLFSESGKVKSLDELSSIIEELRKNKKQAVWTNGCFDILHPGHIEYLREAKSYGDVLVVGLNSDNSIKKLKGPERPILNEEERAKMLSALEFVDYVIINPENDFTKYLKALKPAIYVKGGDYQLDTINAEERGIVQGYKGKIVFAKIIPETSTSRIISKIKNGRREK